MVVAIADVAAAAAAAVSVVLKVRLALLLDQLGAEEDVLLLLPAILGSAAAAVSAPAADAAVVGVGVVVVAKAQADWAVINVGTVTLGTVENVQKYKPFSSGFTGSPSLFF